MDSRGEDVEEWMIENNDDPIYDSIRKYIWSQPKTMEEKL